MHRTNIYLEDRQTAMLDRLANDEGISRAELIRRILDRALQEGGDDVRTDLARLDLAFSAPVEIELPSRSAGAREALVDDLEPDDRAGAAQ